MSRTTDDMPGQQRPTMAVKPTSRTSPALHSAKISPRTEPWPGEAGSCRDHMCRRSLLISGVGVLIFLTACSALRAGSRTRQPVGEGATTLEWTLPFRRRPSTSSIELPVIK